VVRRILRRAIRYGWDRLNLKEPFFHKLVAVLARQFADVFPVLVKQEDYVENVILSEEKSFLNTLGQGIELFEEMTESEDHISGEDAFKLHDTYGFPIDLTQLMADEQGVTVDVEGFNERMKQQKERARAAGKFSVDQSSAEQWISVNETDAFEFVGYDELASEGHIKMMRQQDEQNEIILDRTPFYAESGGQVADTGMMSNGEEYLRVLDVQKSPDGYIHFTDKFPEYPEGEWQAMVDKERRREVRKHHSATHLVHAALKEVLGDHIAQKGSLVDETHLRFDFSHFEQITPDQLNRIEELVNEKIQQNIPLQEDRRVPIEEARERGAIMLFGEKYGDRVRVISFDADFSMELCGGTHVNATGEIGYFRLVSEASAAAGVRRIEARAGQSADRYLRSERDLLNNIRALVGQSDDLVHDISSLINDRKSLEKEVEKLKHQQSLDKLNELFDRSAQLEGNILLVSGEIGQADMDLLKQLGYESLEKSKKRTVTVLAARAEQDGKVYIAATVTDDLISEEGIKAGNLVGKLGRMLGGGGGGQPDIATAGGRNPDKLNEMFTRLPEIINEEMQKS
ncbi:MAG TPA: alanine--tRNA ligase, partial [Fodinibius sp.]|nr:alanine--tRNA ligase [Fodinibius sp.]